MREILTKATVLVAVIILGYVCKKVGLFKKEDSATIGKITINITLPAAIILSFQGIQVSFFFIVAIIIGFVCTVGALALAKILHRKRNKTESDMHAILCSGYNIGNFAIPYATSFLPVAAMPYIFMFDTGATVMVTGGSYAYLSSAGKGGKINMKPFLKKLCRAIPLIAYVTMIVLSLVNVSLPSEFMDWVKVLAGANVFLSFFMVGIAFELKICKEDTLDVIKVLALKYLWALSWCAIIYFVLPLPLEMKQGIVISLLAPIPSAGMVFGTMLGCKLSVLGVSSSLSVVISMVLMTTVALMM